MKNVHWDVMNTRKQVVSHEVNQNEGYVLTRMCAGEIFRIKYQLPLQITNNLGRIRQCYSHETCSMMCPEHTETIAIPWIEKMNPENVDEQSSRNLNTNSLFEQCG